LSKSDLEAPEQELAELDSKRAGLILKVNALRNAMSSGEAAGPQLPLIGRPVLGVAPASNAEKVTLFITLFRCRENMSFSLILGKPRISASSLERSWRLSGLAWAISVPSVFSSTVLCGARKAFR